MIDLEETDGRNRVSGEGTVGRIDSIAPVRVEIHQKMPQKNSGVSSGLILRSNPDNLPN